MNPIENVQSMFLSSVLPCANPPLPSPKYKFCCKKCDFYTNKSCNYIEHLKTNKHKITVITNPVFVQSQATADNSTATAIVLSEPTELTDARKTYPCNICNKSYYSTPFLI